MKAFTIGIVIIISLIISHACEPLILQDFPHLDVALSKVEEDSVFSFEKINRRVWDSVYVIRSVSDANLIGDISMPDKLRKRISTDNTFSKGAYLIFARNHELTNFCKINKNSADFTYLGKRCISRDAQFTMGSDRRVVKRFLSKKEN